MQPGVLRFVVLFPLALMLLLGGAHPLAAACFVLLVAQTWIGGDRARAAAVAVFAGVVSGLLFASVFVALAHTAAAAGGIPIALLMERGWSYGRRLVAVATAAFAVAALDMFVHWRSLREDVTVLLSARINDMAENDVANEQLVEVLKWFDVNYGYLGIGSVFGFVLLACAFVLSVLDRWQQDPETLRKRRPSGFQRMQVPDGLVWIAIAVALLWFVDQRWHNEILRAVTWNTAIGLSFVYWLNGFSILLYSLSVFKATAFATFMVFSGFVLFHSLLPALGVLGFFDTWYNFRMRFRRFALLRRLSYRSGGREL